MRILTIDGGGVRAVVAAAMLAQVEELIQKPLNQYFDLIAGTSAGAIVASAIATGMPAKEILNFFKTASSKIFPYQSILSPQRLELILKYGLSAPKFSPIPLEEQLYSIFGNIQLSEVQATKLLITSFDTLERSPIIFKSWRRDSFSQVRLVDALLSSTAAPTYFPANYLYLDGKDYSAIDGGVTANNPSVCAVAEALRLGHDLENISLLSVGTGDPTRAISLEQAQSWGAMEWSVNAFSLLFESPSGATNYISRELLGDRYLRLQFKLDRKLTGKRLSDDIDDASAENIANLIEASECYIHQPEIDIQLSFFLLNTVNLVARQPLS